MRPTRLIDPLILGASLALVLAACGGEAASPTPGSITALGPQPSQGQAVDGAGRDSRPAPELVDLVNPDGSPFDLADFRGSPTLVFLGCSHCPDVCPTTIGQLFDVFEAAPDGQAIFVSVDPERGAPEFLAEWTQYFPGCLC